MPPKLSQSLLVFHLRKLMYIFQEMIDTERDYVKSLQYIMDVSQLRFLQFFYQYLGVCCALTCYLGFFCAL